MQIIHSSFRTQFSDIKIEHNGHSLFILQQFFIHGESDIMLLKSTWAISSYFFYKAYLVDHNAEFINKQVSGHIHDLSLSFNAIHAVVTKKT